MENFTKEIKSALRRVSLNGKLISEMFDESSFGNSQVIFEIGPLRLRFIKDRSQEFVDIASAFSYDRYYLFCDVEIALGWQTIEDVLVGQEPEPLIQVLNRIARRFDELKKAFSENYSATKLQIERASAARTDAWLAQIADKHKRTWPPSD